MRSIVLVLVLACALATPAAPTPFVRAPGGVTFHFHSLAPVSTIGEVTDFVVGAERPTMSSDAPAGAADKVAHPVQGSESRGNAVLAYWAGAAQGNVGNASVSMWVVAERATTLSVTLYGDADAIATGKLNVPAMTAPTLVTIPLAGAGMVTHEMVVSVFAGLSGVAILFDSTAHDSTLAFDLGPYVAPPPPVGVGGPLPGPAAGWAGVTTVSLSKTSRETSIAIDPTDDAHLFECAPSGVPNTPNGQSYFWQSFDGGATWAYVRVETSSTDGREYTFEGGDCDVAFDAAGTMYSADTWLGDLSVGNSLDGGVTWAGTPLAVTSPVVDRPWLVGGPAGTIHVSYQDVQFGMPTAIWYTRSTDGGATFLPAVLVAGPSATDGGWSWEGNFVVSPDQQDLYLVYTHRSQEAGGGENGPETVWVAASHDAGLTWTQHLVASSPNAASFLYPSIAMDGSGMLHVVYSSKSPNGADHPIWYASSTDGAESWSAPIKVLAGVQAYSPWVAAGPTRGEVAVQFLGSPNASGLSEPNDWYVYAGRITHADTTPVISVAPTTSGPLFHGSTAVPEFNMVRLDSQGRMHLGLSFVAYNANGGTQWAEYYQHES